MGTVTVPLTQGKIALIDEEDWPVVGQYKWHAYRKRSTWYAGARMKGSETPHRMISMHRLILNAPPRVPVDHRDHNGLNNTRSNIRIATPADNQHNRGPSQHGTSRYKGVSWCTKKARWVAQIRYGGKTRFLGYFLNEEDAAHAYDEAASVGHGEFAYRNFPGG